jgi:hypothetical protein
MASFDIETLVNFQPPWARCPHCFAIWRPGVWGLNPFQCETCKAILSPNVFPTNPFGMAHSVLGPPGYPVELSNDPLQHATELGRLARDLRRHDKSILPLRSIMLLLLRARAFMHITTLSLDEFMLAVLEMASQTVQTNIVVSGLLQR